LLDSIPEPETLPGWLSEEDLGVYVREFERTGFTGGLNRYRNVDRDWEELANLADTGVSQPALFIAGELDTAVRLQSLDTMRAYVPNLRDTLIIPGCGHWVQQERPGEVNDRLLSFLQAITAADGGS
jgi:epoxide hydrolase A/B